MLISISEAEKLIDKTLPAPKSTAIPLIEANGFVMSVDIKAERDYPPFDRVTKDGIALASASFTGKGQHMKLSGYAQGRKPRMILDDVNTIIEVATGAPLPQGTDAVIPYEEIEKQADSVILNTKQIRAGQHIHPQGSDCKKGPF